MTQAATIAHAVNLGHLNAIALCVYHEQGPAQLERFLSELQEEGTRPMKLPNTISSFDQSCLIRTLPQGCWSAVFNRRR